MQQKLYIALGFMVWTVIHMAVLHLLEMPWFSSFKEALACNIMLLLCALFTAYPLKFYLPNKKSITQLIFLVFGVSFLWLSVSKWLVGLVIDTHLNLAFYSDATWYLRWAVALLILSFVVLLRWMSVLLGQQTQVQTYQRQAMELAKQTELNTLREQLHPHFLFNTLNSVSALIGVKPDKARNMVLQLSDFLRTSIATKENRKHALAEELKQISLYLDIEKVRFGHRLKTNIHCHGELKNHTVPVLILQPLVENAVKYGLYDTTEAVEITVEATLEDGLLLLRVSNPFDSNTSSGLPGTGFGHRSVKRSLYLLYGRTDLFSLTQKEGVFKAEVKIPRT